MKMVVFRVIAAGLCDTVLVTVCDDESVTLVLGVTAAETLRDVVDVLLKVLVPLDVTLMLIERVAIGVAVLLCVIVEVAESLCEGNRVEEPV